MALSCQSFMQENPPSSPFSPKPTLAPSQAKARTIVGPQRGKQAGAGTIVDASRLACNA